MGWDEIIAVLLFWEQRSFMSITPFSIRQLNRRQRVFFCFVFCFWGGGGGVNLGGSTMYINLKE